jgi:formate-dependent nitrite reductase membrane component NrfD
MPAPTFPLTSPPPAPSTRGTLSAAPQDTGEPSYYTVSILKPPVWKWEIAGYFFLGGMSAGAFILSRLAARFGKDSSFRQVERYGAYIACAAAVPCPLLLIHDLGDPARFHHMLRVWKPSSPMNLGTWVLSSITPIAFLNLGRHIHEHIAPRHLRRGPLNVAAGVIGIVSDVAGVPLALMLATYTGVLLSNTSTPIWRQDRHLSPLFAVGSLSTGASAISLVMHVLDRGHAPTPATRAMKTLDTVLHVAEVAGFANYLRYLGPLARPFFQKPHAKHTAIAFGGILTAELIKQLPVPKSLERSASLVGTVAGLASAFALRWVVVHAAHTSASNPEDARLNSKPRDPQSHPWHRLSPEDAPRERTGKRPDSHAVSDLVAPGRPNPRHI